MLQHNTLRRFIHQYSTSLCYLCGLTIDNPTNESIWCDHCLTHFASTSRCQQCGLPTPITTPHCGACLTDEPLWHRLYCVGDYAKPLSKYIHNLKYKNQTQIADDLAYLLAGRITEPAPLLTCVPLHWQRFFRRGYNQSSLLGRYLCQHLHSKTRFDYALFKRTRSTPNQQGLNKQERMNNLRHAFALNYVPTHSHIAIVDDVVTTGSTMRQLCALLLEVGVKKIDIYCICRTGE